MAKKHPALVMGTTKSHLRVDTDNDGMSPEKWVRKNAEFAGMSDKDWLNQFSNNINNSAWAKQEGKVPMMNTPDDLRGVWDTEYENHASENHGGSDEIWAMNKAGGANYDSSYQYRTKISRDTGEKEQRRFWDFSKQAWVIKNVPKIEYLDPANGYGVGNFPPGSIVQYKNDATGQNACTVVGDTGTNKAEMTPSVANQLGIPLNGHDIPTTGTTASVTYLGQSSQAFPTPESVQSDCQRLQAEWQKKQEEAKEKAKKKKGGKQADNQEQGGAFYLAQVEDHGVRAGSGQLLVAIAHPSCLHSGQQPVITGSKSICVGTSLSPLAGEGDLTKDEYVIRDKTGDQTIEMT
jgi:hypothetical protein